MHRDRLLERVSQWEQAAQGARSSGDFARMRRRETGTTELLRSVVSHLTRLLNTRQGFVPLDESFGVRDFTNLGGGMNHGEIADVEQQLQSMIERYEPRLLHPVVRLCRERSDALGMSFTVEASMAPGPNEYPLQLATRIDAQGQVRVHTADD